MSKIGDFLVQIGVMTKDQVEIVLIKQKLGDTRIFGEIAIEMGFLNDDSIKRYVEYMERENVAEGRPA